MRPADKVYTLPDNIDPRQAAMLRVNPAVHAAAVKASARSGQSLNKWAEKVLGLAAHS